MASTWRKRAAAKRSSHLLAAVAAAATVAALAWTAGCDVNREGAAFQSATDKVRQDATKAQQRVSAKLAEAGPEADLEALVNALPLAIAEKRVDAARRSVELDLVFVAPGTKMHGEVLVALCVRVSGVAGVPQTQMSDVDCRPECIRLMSQVQVGPSPPPGFPGTCPENARATVDRIVKLH